MRWGISRINWAVRLSMSRNNIKIGVILQGAETPFMKEVLKGIQEACAEVDNLGGTVLVHKIEHQNAEDVILAMEKMRMEEVSGIAMVPLDEERVKRELIGLWRNFGSRW